MQQNATDEEVYRVAKLSFCQDFITIYQTMETLIGENGVRLSGGEKQRLSIARAMMNKVQLFCLTKQHPLWTLRLKTKYKKRSKY